MSLSSTSTIKNQLNASLGQKADRYWEVFKEYVSGQISRLEFDETVRVYLDTPYLVQQHNALIISLFDTTSHQTPPTPPPEVPKPPSRKRRRTLPYQGTDELDYPGTLRSERLKRWTIGLGRAEREKVKSLEEVALSSERRPRKEKDEVARERGVVLLREREDPPGTRMPLHLASITRAPTFQHISDRVNLISAQHNLGTPSKTVTSLVMLAFEAKLKQLIIQALSLTSTSHAISTIHPSATTHHQSHKPPAHKTAPVLTSAAFQTLFTVCPNVLPNKSGAALRFLSLNGMDPGTVEEEEDLGELGGRDHLDAGAGKDGWKVGEEERWQLMRLLGERSGVREALRGLR